MITVPMSVNVGDVLLVECEADVEYRLSRDWEAGVDELEYTVVAARFISAGVFIEEPGVPPMIEPFDLVADKPAAFWSKLLVEYIGDTDDRIAEACSRDIKARKDEACYLGQTAGTDRD